MNNKGFIRCMNPNCNKKISSKDACLTFKEPINITTIIENPKTHRQEKRIIVCSEKCRKEYIENRKEKY